ncbi:uncharacterized protein LOC107640548 [Arachis ipaensis]|uniref:uncharacterized protein LOC107640548 n=1 Tax=Arachis ipaensis TaxID=130454 RepID=UPI0007AEF122|nr:uncharacterized protein LOC107640548 [Arachis ipaensis]
MVSELQQANQCMVEENQRMANQIVELTNARIKNNHPRQEQTKEHQCSLTHVSETARNEEGRPQQNEEARPENENAEPENSTGPFTAKVMNFELLRRFTLLTTLIPYDGLGDPKKYIKKFKSIMIVNDSISHFQELAKLFEENFAGLAIYLHDSDYLNTVKQGYQILSFMDAYSGYNQILMHPSDQSKTAFITEYENYCYKVMPFGLKNAGATYQCLMDKVFAAQIGRSLEVYVDDMVAKTKLGDNHLDDLAEIFNQIRKYNMRLNLEKCAFGVQEGKFLGFMLTNRGIEANPEKCRAILDMASLQTIKEVQ